MAGRAPMAAARMERWCVCSPTMLSNSLSLQEHPTFIKLTLQVRTAVSARSVLAVCAALTTLLFALIAGTVEIDDNHAGVLLGVTAAFGALVVLPWWYLIWNTYGKEHLLITTKSITHQLDHGFVLLRPKTHLHRELLVDLDLRDPGAPRSMGSLVFARLNERTGIPEEIMRTTILLRSEDLSSIRAAIARLYEGADLITPPPPPSLN